MGKEKRRLSLFILFNIVKFVNGLSPYRLGLWIGARCGEIAFLLLGKERKKTERNLEIAFQGNLSARERRKIAINVFRNLGRTGAEILKLPYLNKKKLNSLIEINGADNLKEARARGRGIVIVTSHLDNWEMLAAYFAANYGANVMARRLRDKRFDAVLNNIRRSKGINVIYRDEPPRRFLEALKRNEVIGILPDQDVDSVEGVFVEFFGRQAYTPTGPVALALASGAPILPAFIVRNGRGHKIYYEPPIYAAKTGDKERDLLNYTKEWSAVAESYVRRFPDQWVWMHSRWKTKKK